MAFLQARSCDADKLPLPAQVLDGRRAAVTHAGAQAAHQLIDRIGQWSLIRHATLHAFRHQLLVGLLEIAVAGAVGLCHGAQAAHAAVHLEAAALIDFHISRALVHTGKEAA